jgi:hypothetical protein
MVPAIDETRGSWAATLLRPINEVTRSPWRVIVVNFRCVASLVLPAKNAIPSKLTMTPWNFKFGHRSADLRADLALQFKYSVP